MFALMHCLLPGCNVCAPLPKLQIYAVESWTSVPDGGPGGRRRCQWLETKQGLSQITRVHLWVALARRARPPKWVNPSGNWE